MSINIIAPESWKEDIPAFREKTEAFYKGEVPKGEYKGFSGFYGSYAQKGGQAGMIRLRMTAGRVTREKLAFTAQAIRKYNVNKMHFTTCEAIQLHNLDGDSICKIMEEALDSGIVTMGGGGDFPRNVMCAPLTGVEKDEYFDVLPYAEAAGQYLMNFIKAEKMPRKLKVCFSNSPANVPHATFRDLGFVARPDGKFDVYSAGGLGNNHKMGVKVAEAVEPEKILYYIKAMWITFRTYGNYDNRGKARTRYMQDACGGPEGYYKAYNEKLAEVFASGENLDLEVSPITFDKTGDGSTAEDRRILPQKQEGLYTVVWHTIGGQPSPARFCEVADAVLKVPGAEMRLSGDETAYIINLTGDEAKEMLKATYDSAATEFETSVSCIGATVCQVGLRDSFGLLGACVAAVREADIPDGALPQIHISGCPSSCGTHQIGIIGFRGAGKKVNGAMAPAFNLYYRGCDRQGEEQFGRELGAIAEKQIPEFLVVLGKTVAASGLKFREWDAQNPGAFEAIAAPYLA